MIPEITPVTALGIVVAAVAVAIAYRYGKRNADCCSGHDWEAYQFTLNPDERFRMSFDTVLYERKAKFSCSRCNERKTDYKTVRKIKLDDMELARGVHESTITGKAYLS